jgi:hypothetical protein
MSLTRDLGYAVRTLRRNPGYTAAALLTLMLGLGANAAVFSVVHGILLAPLPYANADQLVRVREVSLRGRPMDAAWQNFIDWRERARSFETLAAHGPGRPGTVLVDDAALRVGVTPVSAGFFGALGTAPIHGRVPVSEEHRLGAPPVVVVSEGFWRNQLGADPDPSSRLITVGTSSAQIVGVMPGGFDFPAGTDVWIPLELEEQSPYRTSHNWTVLGRLRPGTGVAAADAELDGITETFLDPESAVGQQDGFEEYFPGGAVVAPLRVELVGSVSRPLWILLGASVLVLLVAFSNLESDTLARGTGREREFVVRH